MSFVHLHLHSEYSFDSQIRVSPRRHPLRFLQNSNKTCSTTLNSRRSQPLPLINRLQELGQTAAALTDHGTMRGVIDFYNICRQNGIKPLLGCEVYALPFSRRQSYLWGCLDNRLDSSACSHLTLIAKNSEGYSNLCQMLSSVSAADTAITPSKCASFEHCLTPAMLARHSRGIICLSGCLSGPVSQALLCGDYQSAQEHLAFPKDIFHDDLFVELMNHGLPEQQKINPLLLQLAQELQLLPIATNDVHHLTPADTKHTAEAENSPDTPAAGSNEHPQPTPIDDEQPYINPEEYLKSEAEMLTAFSFCPQAVYNAQLVAERADDDVLRDILDAELILPRCCPAVLSSSPDLSSDACLKELCLQGASKRLRTSWNEAYQQRLDLELEIIAYLDFAPYFLLIQDFTSWAREQEILVGPGLGAEGCSLVAYLLGITGIDPVIHNLPCERFINSCRSALPDIDIACNTSAQPLLAQYIYNKYSEKHAAFIVYDGDPRPGSLSIALTGRDIKGLAPCCPAPISLINTPSTWCAYDKRSAEQLGMYPVDLLANAGLELLQLAQQRLSASSDPREAQFSIEALIRHPDAPQVYKMLSTGDAEALFYVDDPRIINGRLSDTEFPALQDYLQQLQPTCLNDLTALLALYRPTPISSGLMDRFISAKRQAKEGLEYPHPLLKPILAETYGIFVYQEQLMQAFHDLGGFSWCDADGARRAFGRMKLKEILAIKTKFFEGASSIGLEETVAAKIFAAMENYASPTLPSNKSHALGQALTAYCLAYLKCHYPQIYQAARIGSLDK
ncbi:MAG: PHP domain-containing protein [bacterium]|nr:PHP domain-containing protein [bacterium]